MSILVLAEHDNASLKSATLHAVTAAQKIGGDIHILVAGAGAQGAADAAAKVAGVAKVLLADEIVTRARQTGAQVTFVEDPALLADVGGIGATLRFKL